MRVGEIMEVTAALVVAVGVFALVIAAVPALFAAGASLLVLGAFLAYAAQTHEYGGNPVKRAESS